MAVSQAQDPKLYSSHAQGVLLMREVPLHHYLLRVQLGDKFEVSLAVQLGDKFVAAQAFQVETNWWQCWYKWKTDWW